MELTINICVLGLGYVGLPLAISLSKQYSVVGYDINETLVKSLKSGKDLNGEVTFDQINGSDVAFTSSLEDIKQCNFYIVTVPTPVDDYNVPNLKPLRDASEQIGSVLEKGNTVVYESTVYPGATEEICVPILSKKSSLIPIHEFKFGYSPERINPGDAVNTVENIIKLVSGCDDYALNLIDEVYGSVITAGTHKCSSIKIAEASKVIENTQRDINIAFMNELSIVFDKLNINTYEVLQAAATKWNFLNFQPGLVGGHCISVDPYYLKHKSEQNGVYTELIGSARRINDSIPSFIVQKLIRECVRKKINITKANVLLAGCSFKENCSDIRNSKALNIFDRLEDIGISCDIYDPHVDTLEDKYTSKQVHAIKYDHYDILILAVAHDIFKHEHQELFLRKLKSKHIVFDVKNITQLSENIVRL